MSQSGVGIYSQRLAELGDGLGKPAVEPQGVGQFEMSGTGVRISEQRFPVFRFGGIRLARIHQHVAHPVVRVRGIGRRCQRRLRQLSGPLASRRRGQAPATGILFRPGQRGGHLRRQMLRVELVNVCCCASTVLVGIA